MHHCQALAQSAGVARQPIRVGVQVRVGACVRVPSERARAIAFFRLVIEHLK